MKEEKDNKIEEQPEIEQEDVQYQEIEIEGLEAQITVANDKYVRLMAEFDNFRRRNAKERLDLIGSANEEFVIGILPILDDCEIAIKVLRDSADSKASIEGTELIYTKLLNYLKGKGVSEVDAIGLKLDTDYHEAVAQIPAQDKAHKDKIVDVVQKGYMLNGKVIRFAKVVLGV